MGAGPRRYAYGPGTLVKRYRIVGEVGRGGMGVVYEATDEALQRRVALKFVDALVSDDGRRHERLLREGQALARLSHPNVVPVFDVGAHEGDVFVAMEFVEGVDLSQWLAQASRSRAEVLEVLLQAGRGLAHAHAVGLVHRDFKPHNVLVREDGCALVADFGLALSSRSEDASLEVSPGRPPDDHVASSLTRPGAAAGTPAYMAPEQGSRGSVGVRSDVFSFCVTAWEGRCSGCGRWWSVHRSTSRGRLRARPGRWSRRSAGGCGTGRRSDRRRWIACSPS